MEGQGLGGEKPHEGCRGEAEDHQRSGRLHQAKADRRTRHTQPRKGDGATHRGSPAEERTGANAEGGARQQRGMHHSGLRG